MYIFGYLRASTSDQNAKRAQSILQRFVQEKGFRIAGWYIENESGASLQRPGLLRLLDDAAIGDAIIMGFYAGTPDFSVIPVSDQQLTHPNQ
jgi:DNA invertase Pin-like site-specific DNA recombinase